MKRFVSMILILTLLSMCLYGCGKKSEPKEKGDEITLQPVTEVVTPASEVVPEASDGNSVGLMAFYPNADQNMFALAGTNCFSVYFENKRIKVGSGKIGIYDANSNSIYTTVNAENTDSYVVSDMDMVGTALTGWGEGTKVDIYFDKVFLPGSSYYVLIDEGFFTLGSIKSAAVTNSSLITFEAKQYGVDLTGVSLTRSYQVNDAISFRALVDGNAATMYALKEYDQTFIEASPINGTTDTTLSLKFLKAGTPSITVAFYNSGKVVDSITFTFQVDGPADPSLVLPPDQAAEGSTSG